MDTDIWYCGKCDRLGIVDYEEHADVMSVCYLLEDNHREVSPDCATSKTFNGYRELQIINDIEAFQKERKNNRKELSTVVSTS